MEFVPTNNLTMDRFTVTKAAALCDFQSFTLFPPGTSSRLSMLLGLGVFIHANVKCAAIDEWRASTWLPRVSPLISFARHFTDIYTSPAFWRNIVAYVENMTIEVCQSEKRGDLVERLKKGRELRLDAGDELLRVVCRHMCFDLVVMRRAGDALTVEVIRSEEAVGLPVVIGEEDDSLLFLYHKNLFDSTQTVNWPYYFAPPKAPVRFPGFVLVESSPLCVLQASHELLTSTIETIVALSRVGLPSAVAELLDTLKKMCDEYGVVAAMYGLKPLELLASVEEAKEYTDEDHPLGYCSKFALLDKSIDLPVCEHRFHTVCLSKHYQQQLDAGQSSSSLQCPLCSVPVSTETLDQLTLQFHTDLLMNTGSLVQADFYDCRVCSKTKSVRVMLGHQGSDLHYVCIECFQTVQNCPFCNGEVPPLQQAWLEQASLFLGIHR